MTADGPEAAVGAPLLGATELAVWHTLVRLKIGRIRDSLTDPTRDSDGYVFARFRASIDHFLKWIEQHLHVDLSSDDREAVLRILDELALYMRFFESPLLIRAPHPLVDHVQSIFTTIDPQSLILLRPQNEQTFETRPHAISVIGKLVELAKLFPRPFAKNDFVSSLRTFPNIFIVSYPKYLGEVFLFYPILGHEIGHVLFALRNFDEDLPLLSEKAFPLTPEITSKEELKVLAKRALAEEWATELYCDRVGYRLYGEPYIYALWLILKRSPESLPMPAFADYVVGSTARISSFIRILFDDLAIHVRGRSNEETVDDFDKAAAVLNEIVLNFVKQRDAERYTPEELYTAYPSPGRRLQALVKTVDQTAWLSAMPEKFREWRRELREHFTDYVEQYGRDGEVIRPNPEYAEVAEAATAVADKLFAIIEPSLPPAQPIVTDDLKQLVEKISSSIPPCEIVKSETQQDPAAWQSILLAAWGMFIHNVGEEGAGVAAGNGWPERWLAFIYQSIDMNALYRSYRDVQAALRPDGD